MSPPPVITIQFNGQSMELSPDTSVEQLLELAEMRSKLVAVEINREIVPRKSFSEHMLHTGDVVEAVTLVGGG